MGGHDADAADPGIRSAQAEVAEPDELAVERATSDASGSMSKACSMKTSVGSSTLNGSR